MDVAEDPALQQFFFQRGSVLTNSVGPFSEDGSVLFRARFGRRKTAPRYLGVCFQRSGPHTPPRNEILVTPLNLIPSTSSWFDCPGLSIAVPTALCFGLSLKQKGTFQSASKLIALENRTETIFMNCTYQFQNACSKNPC